MSSSDATSPGNGIEYSELFDVAVIGAGIVGLATSYVLLNRSPGLRLAVIDKEPALAQHQSRHNSGVVHSGVYYPPGSQKAELCVRGARELRAYCRSKALPFERCGKVIIACEQAEIGRLTALYERGRANGVEDLAVIGPSALAELEPNARGIAALWIPGTAITDFAAVAHAFAGDIERGGGALLLDHNVVAMERDLDHTSLTTSQGTLRTRHVLVCAGLQADRMARLTGSTRQPAIVPFRGSYWALKAARRSLVRGLIYPVPDPSFPFLGVHFTRRVDGAVWVGPNAVPALAREGYGRHALCPRDLADLLREPGLYRLVRKYWRTGLEEIARDLSLRLLVRSLRHYVPDVGPEDLVAGPTGVRAQAVSARGMLLDDFLIDTDMSRVTHVRNAPSPAATSSLAIGDHLADLVLGRLAEVRAGATRRDLPHIMR